MSPTRAINNKELPEKVNGDALDERQQKLLDSRRAVNQDPRNVVLLNELGLAAEEARDIDRACWAYRRASRLDPSYGPAYLNLGLLLRREGRNQPAIMALENCLKYASRDCDRQIVESTLRELQQEESAPAPVDDSPHLSEIAQDKEIAAGTRSARLLPIDEVEAGPAGDQPITINPSLTKPIDDLGLTPAEALMLLDPEASDGQEMLRYTALDLVNKQVLEVNDSGQIGRGPKFDQSELKRHERLLANYFARFNLSLDLARYTDTLLTRLDNRFGTFKALYVRQVLLEEGYLQVESERWLGFIPVQHYTLTQEGTRVMHQLKRQLKNSQSQIRRLLRRDPELAKAYLAQAGPALLLMDEFSDADFQEWHQLLAEMGFDDYASDSQLPRLPKNSGELIDEIMKAISGG